MKIKRVLMLCALSLSLASASVSFAGNQSGFSGGSKASSTTSAPPARSAPAAPAAAPVQRAAPPSSGFSGGSRTSEAAKPAAPKSITNQVIAQQAQKQAAANAWDNRNKVTVAPPTNVNTVNGKTSAGALPVQNQYAGNSMNNTVTTRREVTVVRQNSSNNDLLAGVLIGQALSNHNQQPQVVAYPRGAYVEQQSQPVQQAPSVLATVPSSSGESSGAGSILLWILAFVVLGGLIFWFLNRNQEVKNHQPRYRL